MNTHWKNFFDYQFLGAYSLEGISGEPIYTIDKIQKEEIKDTSGRAEEVLVCYFVEEEAKPMILNKTNCKAIESAYKTPKVDEWPGKRVQIYVEKNVKAFGKTTDALRIRDFEPKSSEEVEISKIRKEVRGLLSNYNGIDKEEIKALCNDRKNQGTDDKAFYEEIIAKLKA